MSKFKFQSFDKRTIPVTAQPMATLQQKGLLSLNLAAVTALSNPAAVELLYDPDARAIGLKPIDEKDPKAYAIRKQPASQSYLVSAAKLCTFWGIDTSTPYRYAPIMDEDTLVIELDKPVGEASRPKRKKAERRATA